MKAVREMEKRHIMQTYARYPVVISRAKGMYIWDTRGNRYLDFFGGLAVTALGHTSPAIVRAVRDQALKYMHVSNLFYDTKQIALARELSSLFKGKVFFSNSGLEANECAIKIARKKASLARPDGQRADKFEIIGFTNSFHGRSLATLAATGQEKHHKGYNPLPAGFIHARYNDISSVRKLVNSRTCAVIIELIQGEGGVVIADKAFLRSLRKLCDEKELTLIFDEVQTGMGRTGEIFAYQNFGVRPDVITVAKGLGGGLPLGATIASHELSDVFGFGGHGSTFGGNPLSCAAALEVVKFLTKKRLASIRSAGRYFMDSLDALKRCHSDLIQEVRGMGLIIGMQFRSSGSRFVSDCLAKGLILNCTQDRVIRFLPPLIVGRSDIDKAMDIMDKVLSSYADRGPGKRADIKQKI